MSNRSYYKVSYVIEDGAHPGKIANRRQQPAVGEEVVLDGAVYVIVEVDELIAARDDFGFVHATCRYLRDVE